MVGLLFGAQVFSRGRAARGRRAGRRRRRRRHRVERLRILPSPMAIDETTARAIEAPAPGPSAEQLRAAYLELLKLSLCDLAGANTQTAYLSYDKTHRLLAPAERGGDPLPRRRQGLAAARADDDRAAPGSTTCRRCVESVVADGVEGDLIEAGVWRGGASMLMRATLDTLGERRARASGSPTRSRAFRPRTPRAYPADAGLRPQPARVPLGPGRRGALLLRPPRARPRPALRRGLLPRDDARRCAAAAGRSCGSTATPTSRPGSRSRRSTRASRAGGYLIIDDYGFVPACREAVDDYRREHGIDERDRGGRLELRPLAARERARAGRPSDRRRRRRPPPRAARSTPRSGSSRVADRARARARARARRAAGRAGSRRIGARR